MVWNNSIAHVHAKLLLTTCTALNGTFSPCRAFLPARIVKLRMMTQTWEVLLECAQCTFKAVYTWRIVARLASAQYSPSLGHRYYAYRSLVTCSLSSIATAHQFEAIWDLWSPLQRYLSYQNSFSECASGVLFITPPSESSHFAAGILRMRMCVRTCMSVTMFT